MHVGQPGEKLEAAEAGAVRLVEGVVDRAHDRGLDVQHGKQRLAADRQAGVGRGGVGVRAACHTAMIPAETKRARAWSRVQASNPLSEGALMSQQTGSQAHRTAVVVGGGYGG